MREELYRLLVARVARRSGLPEHRIDPDLPFDTYGFASIDAVALSGELEELLDRDLPPTVLWQHPTIHRLTAFLTGGPEQSEQPERPASGPGGPATAPGRRAGDPGDGRSPYGDTDLAVVGLGCRLPGGIASAAGFWELLSRGGDAVTTVPEGRWEPYRQVSPAHAAAVDRAVRHGSFLDDVDGFDAEFFGIAPAEAAEMDPQQRILLEVAWEALEHAGLPADRLAGSRTGVYVGACSDDHGRTALEDLPSITARTGTGSAMSIIANRLSYALDLRGPSMTVDTACSSSLVALHLARRGLLAGECDTALVGGVNLLLSPGVTLNFGAGGVLSPGGRCRPFSAAADGYVRGEGCLVVVVRRLADALRDGDRVLAVVRATGTNQDGRSNGLMAPNPAAQEALIREVWAGSGLDPAEAGYVEAHGTGTPLGDPIEAAALGAALGSARTAGSALRIGSVKSNLGHLEGAAGLAGLAKCVLALHHGVIPPTLHHDAPNPRIPLDEWGLAVVDRATPWARGERPRTTGVSSFGFGGTNAHAVLLEAPVPQTVSITE
ncbi:type I polyketide synthase [Streptomyces sp. G1]|uniref:beta-ketoacyl synthase N-terminal-like domain-containing protein n=1 Tax=Streptomyces sp. G1 TaxID=361572 RepID=UPI00202E669E|nr:type I polyketide synthase [Streptomyces sp. G1]MCM1969368.1 type I polyketide synthase [Streptomyces sp. G1]